MKKLFKVQTIGWHMLVWAQTKEEIRLELIAKKHNWWEITELEIKEISDLPKCKDVEM